MVVGLGFSYKLVNAGAYGGHDSFFRFMIRVISSLDIKSGCAFSSIGACIGGVVAVAPSHKIGVLHGGRLVCAMALEGACGDVKGLDSERHVVYILDLVVSCEGLKEERWRPDENSVGILAPVVSTMFRGNHHHHHRLQAL